MAQKNIDFGTYPDDPDADAIRSAFQKTQENFNEIFAGLADQGVLSINKTPQAGITVSSTTGNVLISANLSCVTVQSNTLQLTINNGTPATTQIIDSASKILQINFPAMSNIPNANIAGNLLLGGWANIGNGTVYVILQNGNITATGNIVAANGNFSGNLNVTGNIANANNIAISNALAGNTAVFSGNLQAANANLGNLVTANFVNVASNLNVVSNISAGNANLGNLAIANFFQGNGSGLTAVTGANITGQVANALVAGTVYTNAQPNITSVGTLTGLGVNGNITAANITANTGVFTGNGSGLSALAGANVTGQVGNALVAGTVYTAAQPNITSVGTLTSLDVTGNISAGNVNAGNLLTANFLTGTLTTNAQPNITSVGTLSTLTVSGNANVGNIGAAEGVYTSNVTAANIYANSGTVGASLLTGTLTTNAQPNITSVGTLSSLNVTGNLSAGNANLGNLARANFLQGDGYLISNISVAAGTYISNGTSNVSVTSSGGNVAITIGATTNLALFTSTGVNVSGTLNVTGNANAGNIGATRFVGDLEGVVLTNAQTNITSLGTLTGLTVNGVGNLGSNSNVIITGGAANSFLMTNGSGNLSWNTATLVPAQGSNTQIIYNDGGSTYAGNAGFTFNKVSGNVAIPGALAVNGNISGNLLTGTLTTAGQPNITTIGTLGFLIVSGNINASNIAGGNLVSANFFSGNGSLLTSLTGANVTGTVPTAGTVTTNAQPNITSVGTLTSLGVNNTITAVSFTANTGVFTGNGSGLTSLAGGNVTGQVANALVAGTVYTAAQPNITSLGTLSSLGVNGNITAANITANTGVFTGNGSGLTNLPGGNISGQVANALVAGTVYTNAQPNITSLGTLTSLGVNNTITAVSFTANTGVFTGNGAGLTNLPAANITGQIANSLISSTVYTNAQPNITSVGTLASLTSSGNINAANLIATSYYIRSVGTGISAAGSAQGNATVLTKEFNQVTTVSAGQGVVLPTAVAGMAITITNTSANSLNVYPASSAAINSLSANAALSQAAGSTLQFIAMTSTQWYTVGATYA
jgi:hypothetical protein